MTAGPPRSARHWALLAKSVMPRSISSASCTPTGVNSTPDDDAAVWIDANPPDPAVTVASRTTATRFTSGVISLSRSSNFAFRLNSNAVKPVLLPPGCARLATRPLPTGSIVNTNTIGMVRLACCKSPTIELAVPTSTSGPKATNSAAYRRKRSVSPAPQRVSICTLRPASQPNCCNPWANAANQACPSESSGVLISRPMRRSRLCCCAPAASGHSDHRAAERGYELPSSDADCHCAPSQWGHARCNMGQDSTPQNGGLRPTSRHVRRRKGSLFFCGAK